jgi:NAD(P)H-dependent FMN reductase
MEEKLKTRNPTVYFIDPLELNLPLLNRMYKEMVDPSEKMKNLRNKINDAEGYLVVTPEYNRGPIRLDKCLDCDDRQYHHTDQ